ncbi:oxidoreductase [Clostridium polyendosporum]|uniref:Oxidoreductase n=1 Tax=Clostridium polyendosporum TaxID=69208 RepID=A0A919VET4_9CLOT|nr:C-GCAxxG-C-C family (seleno)protein [Clostridium polyendosporum]GIM29519.1 oxidoreductase [Clostridium polyendosporum]
MAVNYYNKGYNCGEAIIKSVNKKNDTNIPVSIGSPLGRGMSVGSVCGAVAAGVVTIGFLKGRNNASEENNASKHSRDLMNKVKEKFGVETCIELKRKGVSCNEIVKFVDEYLVDFNNA